MQPEAGTNGITAETQVAKIFEWRRGFNAMHLVDLGIQLGLFKAFAQVPDSVPETIAARLNLHAPYVSAWCTTAYAFGLLEAHADRAFRLGPFLEEILAKPDHPRYLGGYVQLGTQFATDDFRFAVDAFHTGATAPFQGRSPAFADLIAQAIAGVNALVARKILPGIPDVARALNDGGALLEVGCGIGKLQLQIAKAFPAARCTGLEIDPTGIAAAREAVQRAGLADRVSIVQGDVSQAVARESFDVVIMVEVLHEIAPAIRPSVVRGCANALRPGGWMVIVDETYPSTLEQARQPEFQFPIQTGLEELVWGNIVPTREEQEQMLRDAGFVGPIDRSLFGAGFTLILAQK